MTTYNAQCYVNITPMDETIQLLWIGDELSNLERLCLYSYLQNGHSVHLYVYNSNLDGPEGVVLKDGNEILDKSEIFVYQSGCGKGSVSAFSNLFRYALLYQKGGWWSDTDVVCLKHLDFQDKYVFSAQIKIG